MGFVIMGAGLFSVVCAAADFDWYMNSRRARLFVTMLGRGGARIFYVVLGVVLMGLGGALQIGMVR